MKDNTLFKLVGETDCVSNRETSILELVATTLKKSFFEHELLSCSGVEYFDMESIIDIADDMADIQANKLIKHNKVVNYHSDLEAFTCEISGSRVYILKHSTIDKALRYALDNIGEISVIFNDKLIVFGGYVDDKPFWLLDDEGIVIDIDTDYGNDTVEPDIVCDICS